MNIAFDISDLSTGRADGTTRYTFELARRLPLLTPADHWLFHAPFASTLTQEANSGQGNSTPIMTPWPKYWTQLRLPFALYRHPADVLVMPIQQIPYLRPKRLKTVVVVHDLAFHYYPEQFTRKDWLLLHTFTAYAARVADQLIAVSQATADDIAKQYGRTENVTVIHHGLNHQQFKPLNETMAMDSWQQVAKQYPTIRQPYLLYVGQIQPRKNLERLVTAFEQLKPEHPQLQLVIAGGHGWLQAPIFARIKASPFRHDIVITGRVADEHLPALYQRAAAYVLPSLYEGFGMPILEAMACGAPVVTSNVSSMPEVAGNAAVVVDPLSANSMAAGITQVLRDPHPWRERGLARAAEFTWDKTARETRDVINRCL